MAPLCSCRRLLGVAFLLLGVSLLFAAPADAQDRSVPRFGPLVNPDTVTAGPFDFGRVWSFAQPPLEYFAEKYDVRADERGLRHARLGTVRLPDCSGAIVSQAGLVLTAARCVRPHLGAVDDSLRTAAFYAESRAEERGLPGLYAEQVVGVETVTAAVEAARSSDEGEPSGEQAAIRTVEQRRQAEAEPDRRVEVVREAGGMRYVAYTYRRYDDVRLAFVPDRAVTGAGRVGAPLSYPQHAWDVAVLRLYEDDQPLRTPQHLELRAQGARPGDAVFAVAHPPKTHRAETHEQLAVRRDVTLPARLSVLAAAGERLRRYVDTTQAAGTAWAEQLSDIEEQARRARARLGGLRNEYVMARLQSRDRELRRGGTAAPALAAGAEEALERGGTLQEEKQLLTTDYRAFSFLLHPTASSATLRRALLAYRAREGAGRAPMGGDDALNDIPTQPAALDAAALADHLRRLRTHLSSDSTVLRALPDPASASSLVRTSLFSDPEAVRERVENETLPDDDPAFQVVSAFYDRYTRFREAWETVRSDEHAVVDTLSRVRHRAAPRPVTLPDERTLRIADGRIKGYPYNGTVAPPFTTFYGVYERHHALRDGGTDGTLPRRWRDAAETLDRSTPLTTAASVDLGAGAHGGPLLNTSLELVGVVFDGNAQSAAGDYLFLPRRMRAVAVDVRGVLEGLSAIYGADRLTQEMTTETAR
jgi:hypothetical protein